MHLIGNVEGYTAILVDDLVDTAGTLTKAAKATKANGATRVLAICTHGVLSGPAHERIENSVIEKVFVTDTIPIEKNLAGKEAQHSSKIQVVSVAFSLQKPLMPYIPTNLYLDCLNRFQIETTSDRNAD